MSKFVNTSRNIYLVKFRESYKSFVIQSEDLLNLLKDNSLMTIENIKIFEPSKNRFIYLSKSDLKRFSVWQTELREILTTQKAI